MTSFSNFFQSPTHQAHRRYEALRAYYVDGVPGKQAAERFGYAYGSFKNLCHAFRKNPTESFFWPSPKKPLRPTAKPEDPRRARVIALRQTYNASIYQIVDLLAEEGLTISAPFVDRILKEAGFEPLSRRPPDQRSLRTLKGLRADRRRLNLTPRTVTTHFGGLFLFAFDLARIGLNDVLDQMPGSSLIPAREAVLSLLALKLWGIGRPSQVMAETLDEGLALFTGLNAIPKRSTLTEYAARCDLHFTEDLMHRWFHAVASLGLDLGGGQSFDLDFHTIPYHGDQALIEKHYVSKRSRRQRGIVTFLARDADARLFCYADGTFRKKTRHDAILRYVDAWTQRTGSRPAELVFDSRLTTYANLSRLNAMGIAFITLRRRHTSLMQDLLAVPTDKWRKISLKNIHRTYRFPRILDSQITVPAYDGVLRQIAVKGLGHDKPTVLITNHMTGSAVRLVDRYARRMIIENVISDAIDFFHMDALSAAVPMSINVDIQLTVMASRLYRLLGIRIGEGLEVAEARTIYRKLIPKRAKITITDHDIEVTYPRRANNPLLLAANYHKMRQPIPWLDNKMLRLKFA